jgi:hypothetical protein
VSANLSSSVGTLRVIHTPSFGPPDCHTIQVCEGLKGGFEKWRTVNVCATRAQADLDLQRRLEGRPANAKFCRQFRALGDHERLANLAAQRVGAQS